MRESRIIQLGVAGFGGYAAYIQDAIMRCSDAGMPIRLASACDPRRAAFPSRTSLLRERGVAVHDELAFMLAEPIDAVWLPVPIHLHRAFSERALAAGKVVMCEKPAAGCVDDLDAMARAAARFDRPLVFGFQDVYDPAVVALKRRILDGVIGTIGRVTITACWPRDSVYFTRNDWAGRLRVGQTWVLDSILNNALAHPVNLALFLLGDSLHSAAGITQLEAELYRANPIETFDTLACRIGLSGGAELLVLMTHACRQSHDPVIRIDASAGHVEVRGDVISIDSRGGMAQRVHRMPRHESMIERFCRLVLSGDTGAPVADVANVRSHLVLVNALTEICEPVAVPTEHLDTLNVPAKVDRPAATLKAIRDVESWIARCAGSGQLFSEAGAPFAVDATVSGVPSDYSHFGGVGSRRTEVVSA